MRPRKEHKDWKIKQKGGNGTARDEEKVGEKGAATIGTEEGRLSATYLLHLVERGLVYAKLLKVILRRSNHLFDDLLVDRTLESQLARMV
jgi:hypothetical protein